MCGRYTIRTNPRQLMLHFGVDDIPDFTPRFNVAPTQNVLCVRQVEGEVQPLFLKWGLVPSWASDPAVGNRMINARAETVAEKPSYRSAFKRRRCLVAADGFYEWQRLDAKRKRPWFFRLKDDGPFAFAGLWERWDKGGEALETCTILTTEANAVLAPVHDRMPVILPPERYDLWLDEAVADPKPLLALLRPYHADGMESRPVGTAVNSPKNDDASLVERAEINST